MDDTHAIGVFASAQVGVFVLVCILCFEYLYAHAFAWFMFFLFASSLLYKMVCHSVRPSVRSVGQRQRQERALHDLVVISLVNDHSADLRKLRVSRDSGILEFFEDVIALRKSMELNDFMITNFKNTNISIRKKRKCDDPVHFHI